MTTDRTAMDIEMLNDLSLSNHGKDITETDVSQTKHSILLSGDDPFAPREGKALLWRNVNMVLVSPHK